MMETTPPATFVMTEADLLFKFQIVALNPPAQLDLVDHAFE